MNSLPFTKNCFARSFKYLPTWDGLSSLPFTRLSSLDLRWPAPGFDPAWSVIRQRTNSWSVLHALLQDLHAGMRRLPACAVTPNCFPGMSSFFPRVVTTTEVARLPCKLASLSATSGTVQGTDPSEPAVRLTPCRSVASGAHHRVESARRARAARRLQLPVGPHSHKKRSSWNRCPRGVHSAMICS